jgi:LysM repeat protein
MKRFFAMSTLLTLAASLLLSACAEEHLPEQRFIASKSPTATLFQVGDDNVMRKAGDFVRGTEVTAYPTQVEEIEGLQFIRLLIDEQEYYALSHNLVAEAEAVVAEDTLWVRTPLSIIGDLERSTIVGFADKKTPLAIVGYDKLAEDGTVATYRVRHGQTEGWAYSKYLVATPEEAAQRYKAEIYDPIHGAIKNSFGGGKAIDCDFYPVEKPSFEDNKMPEACYSLYLNAGTLRNIEKYIALAKKSKINTFVIDIKDNETPGWKADAMKEYSPTNYHRAPNNESLYRNAVKRLHEEGYYVVGRITCFKDSYFVKDNPSCAITEKSTGQPFKHNKAFWPSAYDRRVWEFNVALAKESVVKLGFDEINFDYVRFPDRMNSVESIVDYHNRYGESKVQAIQRFVQFACDEIHKVGAYVSIDVFGEAANPGYTTAYGQYWPAISNVADVISGMPYPDHFSRGYYGISQPWNSPYQILYQWGIRVMDRQKATPTPAVVRTWVQAYNVMKHVDPNGIAYNAANVEREIRGLYAAGLTGGYITWHSGSNLEKYGRQLGAFQRDYLADYKNPNYKFDPTAPISYNNDEAEESTTPEEPKAEEVVAPAPEAPKAEEKKVEEPKAEEAAKAEEAVYHTIVGGDTLYGIARTHGTSVQELCTLNNMQMTDTLRIGKTLRVK